MKNLFLRLLVPRRLHSKEDAFTVLGTLEQIAPAFAPVKVGNFEPLRTPYSMDVALGHWKDPFLWNGGGRPKSNGSVWIPYVPQHTGITLTAETSAAYEAVLEQLLIEWCLRLGADFGFLHVVVPEEVERGIASGALIPLDKKRTRFELSATTHLLRKGVPDLYWLTVFGPPYIELFGRERLLGSPAGTIRELDSDRIALKLSPSYTDLATSHSSFASARDAVRSHLGDEAFGRSASRLPTFSFTGFG